MFRIHNADTKFSELVKGTLSFKSTIYLLSPYGLSEPLGLSEADTRVKLIDPKLRAAGWKIRGMKQMYQRYITGRFGKLKLDPISEPFYRGEFTL